MSEEEIEDKEVKEVKLTKSEQAAVDQAAMIATAVASALKQAGITNQPTELDAANASKLRHMNQLAKNRQNLAESVIRESRKVPMSRKARSELKKPCKGCG